MWYGKYFPDLDNRCLRYLKTNTWQLNIRTLKLSFMNDKCLNPLPDKDIITLLVS